MSEKVPTTAQGRLDQFDALSDEEKYSQVAYGNAYVTDFSSEARQRLEDQKAYEAHMEQFANFSDEEIAERRANPKGLRHALEAENRHVEKRYTEERVKSSDPNAKLVDSPVRFRDAQLRRMEMMAQQIAQMQEEGFDPKKYKSEEAYKSIIVEKEAKLEGLLEAYAASETDRTAAEVTADTAAKTSKKSGEKNNAKDTKKTSSDLSSEQRKRLRNGGKPTREEVDDVIAAIEAEQQDTNTQPEQPVATPVDAQPSAPESHTTEAADDTREGVGSRPVAVETSTLEDETVDAETIEMPAVSTDLSTAGTHGSKDTDASGEARPAADSDQQAHVEGDVDLSELQDIHARAQAALTKLDVAEATASEPTDSRSDVEVITAPSRARRLLNGALGLPSRLGAHAALAQDSLAEKVANKENAISKRGRIGAAAVAVVITTGALATWWVAGRHGAGGSGGGASHVATDMLPKNGPAAQTSGIDTPSLLSHYNIPQGGTGEGIMKAIGHPTSDWYNGLGHELAVKLPSEFTQVAPNDIRVNNPGSLSQAAQNIIANWKS